MWFKQWAPELQRASGATDPIHVMEHESGLLFIDLPK